jgi:hypothetical protein
VQQPHLKQLTLGAAATGALQIPALQIIMHRSMACLRREKGLGQPSSSSGACWLCQENEIDQWSKTLSKVLFLFSKFVHLFSFFCLDLKVKRARWSSLCHVGFSTFKPGL